ncbi:hypothetical protein ACFL09_04610 [Planctomycetota bacterium]
MLIDELVGASLRFGEQHVEEGLPAGRGIAKPFANPLHLSLATLGLTIQALPQGLMIACLRGAPRFLERRPR